MYRLEALNFKLDLMLPLHQGFSPIHCAKGNMIQRYSLCHARATHHYIMHCRLLEILIDSVAQQDVSCALAILCTYNLKHAFMCIQRSYRQ